MSPPARPWPTRSAAPSTRVCWAASPTTRPASASSPPRSARSRTASSPPPPPDVPDPDPEGSRRLPRRRDRRPPRSAMQVFFQTIIGGVSLGAVYALIALGFSLVYRTMGLVNFAHGNLVPVGPSRARPSYPPGKPPFPAGMGSGSAATAAIGLVIERVLRPLENKDFALMLIGTIGFGIVRDALVIMIWGATGRAVPSPV